MDKTSFSSVIGKLYLYFRASKMPSPEQVGIWYDELSYIPNDALDKIFIALKENENIPRNIPKAFKAVYFKLPNSAKVKTYDKYDDPEYPIQFLYTAFGVLANRGKDEFMRYCRSVKMPLQDIERVQNKYNVAFDVKSLTEDMFESVPELWKAQ